MITEHRVSKLEVRDNPFGFHFLGIPYSKIINRYESNNMDEYIFIIKEDKDV